MEIVKQKFRGMAGIDGVVGAVDGTYIPIKALEEHPETYITRKCHYAITLQATCQSNLKFTDCFVGYSGSVSDSRISRNSPLYRNMCHNPKIYFPNGEFLVGDKALPSFDTSCTSICKQGQFNPSSNLF